MGYRVAVKNLPGSFGILPIDTMYDSLNPSHFRSPRGVADEGPPACWAPDPPIRPRPETGIIDSTAATENGPMSTIAQRTL